MKLVELLKNKIAERGVGPPLRWIKEWLFDNALNEGRIIPGNAPVTLITGIQMLFEFPYQAITDYLSDTLGMAPEESLAPYICVGHDRPTEVLIVDMGSKKIISFQKHEAWKFRFKSLQGLEDWMNAKAEEIAKDMGRNSEWQTSHQK